MLNSKENSKTTGRSSRPAGRPQRQLNSKENSKCRVSHQVARSRVLSQLNSKENSKILGKLSANHCALVTGLNSKENSKTAQACQARWCPYRSSGLIQKKIARVQQGPIGRSGNSGPGLNSKENSKLTPVNPYTIPRFLASLIQKKIASYFVIAPHCTNCWIVMLNSKENSKTHWVIC